MKDESVGIAVDMAPKHTLREVFQVMELGRQYILASHMDLRRHADNNSRPIEESGCSFR